MNRPIAQSTFADDIRALYREAIASVNARDFTRLKRIEWVGRMFTIVGYLTSFWWVNPVSILCISLGLSTRWMIAHQILHGGYDRVPGIPHRYTSKGFAQGWRRWLDWPDWIHPKAWVYEHNVLHHRYTGEADDPNMVDAHTELLRKLPIPRVFKYLGLVFIAMMWKVIYYTPGTFITLNGRDLSRKPMGTIDRLNLGHIFGIHRADVRRLWWHCYLPFGFIHFVGAPLLIGLCFGQTAAWVFLINRVLAELVHNVHAFIVILPNHTAPDLSRFDFHYHDRHSFLVCQMMSTVNYRTGHPVGDYLQFWLNYQIEHHLFPDLPMTAYAELVPKVRAICERHGVPYHQEPLSQRLLPMAKVFIGDAQMEVVSNWSAVRSRQ